MASQSGPDVLGSVPPAPPHRQVELRSLIGSNGRNGFGRLGGGERIMCGLRSFWLVADGKEPVRIVHTDPRKERKF